MASDPNSPGGGDKPGPQATAPVLLPLPSSVVPVKTTGSDGRSPTQEILTMEGAGPPPSTVVPPQDPPSSPVAAPTLPLPSSVVASKSTGSDGKSPSQEVATLEGVKPPSKPPQSVVIPPLPSSVVPSKAAGPDGRSPSQEIMALEGITPPPQLTQSSRPWSEAFRNALNPAWGGPSSDGIEAGGPTTYMPFLNAPPGFWLPGPTDLANGAIGTGTGLLTNLAVNGAKFGGFPGMPALGKVGAQVPGVVTSLVTYPASVLSDVQQDGNSIPHAMLREGIATGVGIGVGILATSVGGPLVGTLVGGLANYGTSKLVQLLWKSDGGDVRGPGSSIGDKIPAYLSDGEFVMNARSTSINRPFLQALNSDPFFLQTLLSRRERGNRSSDPATVQPAPPAQPTTVNISASGSDDVVGRLKILSQQWELMHAH